MENSWYFSFVTAGAGHHQEGASEKDNVLAKVWRRWCREYEIEAIQDSTGYARESEGQLPGLYYLVLWKYHPEEENTWEPVLVVHHLQKLINTFHKNHLDKPTATSPLINFALLITRFSQPIKAPKTKQRCGRPTKDREANKQVKKN